MKRQSDFLFIIIPSFIVILLWITFTIFQKATSTTITPTQTTLLKPISPTFDTTVVTLLNKRRKITPNLDESITGVTENQSTSASSSAELPSTLPTQEATNSADQQEVQP